jgi:hypothetical protein
MRRLGIVIDAELKVISVPTNYFPYRGVEVKKLLFILAIIGVLAVMVPGQASALTLTQRVAKIEAKLNCLRYAGLSEWVGYMAWEDGSEVTAASFDTAQGFPHSAGDFRVIVVRPTATCRAKFAPVVTSYLGFAASARTMQESKLEKVR